LEHINWIGTIITFFSAFGGVAVGYGIIKSQVSTNEKNIEKIWSRYAKIMGENGSDPIFVRNRDCDKRVNAMQSTLLSVSEKVVDQGKSLMGLQNFARHWMQREGMTILEINRIINGES